MNKENLDWIPTIVDCKLVGPLPEILDLSNGSFSELDFSSEKSLYISGDSVIKKLIIPCGVIGVNFLCINDLPLLEEIYLIGDPISFFRTFQWIFIGEVPSLKRISLKGNVCSIELENAMSLVDVDLSGCPDLDYFKVSDVPPSFRINIFGCYKLRGVVGLDVECSCSKNVLEQIDANQKNSRLDGLIYEGMTFTDIDAVNDLINEGVKAMSRKGLLYNEDDDSIMGKYYLASYDPEFKPYTFRILKPLELVYTGGTGETYSYVFVQRYVSAEDFSVEDDEGAGNSSPENCLHYMLHWIRMELSHLPNVRGSSDEQLLDILKGVITKTHKNATPDFPIRLSLLLGSAESQSLRELSGEVGMMVTDENIEDYVYVYPESGIPEGDMEIARGAALCAEYRTATMQLTRLRDWIRR